MAPVYTYSLHHVVRPPSLHSEPRSSLLYCVCVFPAGGVPLHGDLLGYGETPSCTARVVCRTQVAEFHAKADYSNGCQCSNDCMRPPLRRHPQLIFKQFICPSVATWAADAPELRHRIRNSALSICAEPQLGAHLIKVLVAGRSFSGVLDASFVSGTARRGVLLCDVVWMWCRVHCRVVALTLLSCRCPGGLPHPGAGPRALRQPAGVQTGGK